MPRKLDVTRHVELKRLSSLDDTLWEWTFVQERYARLGGWQDVAWWYGERAAVSTLAGAVWRAGGSVLQEYAADKGPKGKGLPIPTGSRADFYFGLGRAEFVVEAKVQWVTMRHASPATVADRVLDLATADVRRTKPYGARRLAAAFVLPYLPVKFASEIDSLLEKFLRSVKEAKYDACAWVFPERTRDLTALDSKEVCPGVVLLLRSLKVR
jgi:hypothetical protein